MALAATKVALKMFSTPSTADKIADAMHDAFEFHHPLFPAPMNKTETHATYADMLPSFPDMDHRLKITKADDDGNLEGTVEVKLTHTGPAWGLPDLPKIPTTNIYSEFPPEPVKMKVKDGKVIYMEITELVPGTGLLGLYERIGGQLPSKAEMAKKISYDTFAAPTKADNIARGLHEDFKMTHPSLPEPMDKAGFVGAWKEMELSFPDSDHQLNITSADDDGNVEGTVQLKGTHTGPAWGLPGLPKVPTSNVAWEFPVEPFVAKVTDGKIISINITERVDGAGFIGLYERIGGKVPAEMKEQTN